MLQNLELSADLVTFTEEFFDGKLHFLCNVKQALRNQKNSGGATNYYILSATMAGRRRKFFISNRLKRLEKLNICRSQVM